MFENIVTFQARYRPDAAAITAPSGSISFQKLDTDVNRVARRLADVTPRGAMVAVQVAGSGLHWVVLLALARLGCVSASLPMIGDRQESELLRILRPNVLLTDRDSDAGFPTFRLTEDWIQETFQSSPDPVPAHAFGIDDPVRIVMSSGTTGNPKKMVFTRGIVDARIRTGGLSQFGHRRLHAAIGIDTETGFRAPLVAWATGASAIYPQAGFQWADLILKSRLQALVLVPAQLDGLLNSLPPSFAKPDDLNLVVVSGSLPSALYKRAHEKLTPNIFVTYGSTEAGLAAQASPGLLGSTERLTGIVSPSALIEVVDGDDLPLPLGQAGRVRVKSEEMVSGYLDDDQLTAEFFKNGWFYPGDLGTIDANGTLTVHGREVEVLDVGGSRISPDAIEAVLLACPGIQDAAAFSVPAENEISQIRAAIVCSGPCDMELVYAQLKTALPQIKLSLMVMGSIPRSERGKIDRRALQKEVAALGSANSAVGALGNA